LSWTVPIFLVTLPTVYKFEAEASEILHCSEYPIEINEVKSEEISDLYESKMELDVDESLVDVKTIPAVYGKNSVGTYSFNLGDLENEKIFTSTKSTSPMTLVT